MMKTFLWLALLGLTFVYASRKMQPGEIGEQLSENIEPITDVTMQHEAVLDDQATQLRKLQGRKSNRFGQVTPYSAGTGQNQCRASYGCSFYDQRSRYVYNGYSCERVRTCKWSGYSSYSSCYYNCP